MKLLNQFNQCVLSYRSLHTFMGVILAGILLTGCSSNPTNPPRGHFPPATVAEINKVARNTHPYLYPREDDPFSTGITALLTYDSPQTVSLREQISDLIDRNLSDWETYFELRKLFAEQGILINMDFNGRNDFLFTLNDYSLPEDLHQVLKNVYKTWWKTADLEIPELRAVGSKKKQFDGYNFHTTYLTAIDPRAITHTADRLELDHQLSIEHVALHEAAHAINQQLYARYPDFEFEQRLDELSAATGDRVQFKSESEVEEFLADAVAVQHSDTGVRYAASRIIRAGERLGTTMEIDDPTRTVLLFPHDASAFFIQSLMTEQLNLLYPNSDRKSLSWISALGNAHASENSGLPFLPWIQQHWNPMLDELFTPEFTKRVRDEYLSALNGILEIVSTTSKS